jgi:hypothetical protein
VVLKEDHTETIAMPPAGSLVVDYSAIGGNSTGYKLLLRRAEDPTAAGEWLIHPPAPGSPLVFQAAPVVPDEYLASMRVWSFNDDEETVLVVPEKITVRAGETTRVTSRRP